MSSAYSVIYSPEALDGIKEIYACIAFTFLVPETAEGQVSHIRKEIRSLISCPHGMPVWNGSRGGAWRCTVSP